MQNLTGAGKAALKKYQAFLKKEFRTPTSDEEDDLLLIGDAYLWLLNDASGRLVCITKSSGKVTEGESIAERRSRLGHFRPADPAPA
jgi:hypothetical protein